MAQPVKPASNLGAGSRSVAPFLIRLSAFLGTTVEDGPRPLASATRVGDPISSRILASAWPSSSCRGHLESEAADRRSHSLSFFLGHSAF